MGKHKFLDNVIRQAHENKLSYPLSNPDLSNAKQLNKDLYLFTLAQDDSSTGTWGTDTTKAAFQDQLDSATEIVKLNELGRTPTAVKVFVDYFNQDHSPVKMTINSQSTTPNSEAPDIRYKVITTKNNVSLFTAEKNLNINKNYFASIVPPQINNLSKRITNDLYYVVNIEKVFDEFNHLIGHNLELLSIKNIRKQGENGTIYEWNIDLFLKKAYPKGVKYISFTTTGFLALSPRGLEIKDTISTTDLVKHSLVIDDDSDWLIDTAFMSFTKNDVIYRTFNATEIYATHFNAGQFYEDNWYGPKAPETTIHTTYASKDKFEDIAIDKSDRIDFYLDQKTFSWDQVYLKSLTADLALWKHIPNGWDEEQSSYSHVYTNPFYTKGLTDELQGLSNESRAGNDKGDIWITGIGEHFVKMTNSLIDDPTKEPTHPWQLSAEYIIHDSGVGFSTSAGTETYDEAWFSGLQRQSSKDFEKSNRYDKFLYSGYESANRILINQWPAELPLVENIQEFATVKEDSLGVYNALINYDYYKHAGTFGTRKGDDLPVVFPFDKWSPPLTSLRIHNTHLLPLSGARIDVLAKQAYQFPFQIDRDHEVFNKTTTFIVELEKPTDISQLSLYYYGNQIAVVYLNENKQPIKFDYMDGDLRSPILLKTLNYI